MNNKFFVTLIFLVLSFGAMAQEDNLEQNFDNTAGQLSGLNTEEFNEKNIPVGSKLESNMFTGMMNDVMKKAVQEFLKENPFSKMSEDEVRSMITVRIEGKPVGKFLEKNPKVLDTFVDWLRDQAAIPKLFGILNKPDKMKTYGFIVIAIFILSFALNLMNSKGNLLKRIVKKFAIFAGAFIVNIAAFIFLFKTELQPTLKVILKHFHL